MTTRESGGVTGTRDNDYNLIWYVETCLSKGAEMGKQMMRSRFA